MGGMLADPAANLPGIFGEGGLFGYQWIIDYPYALPSLLNFLFLSMATATTYLFLEEVSLHVTLFPTIHSLLTIADLHQAPGQARQGP